MGFIRMLCAIENTTKPTQGLMTLKEANKIGSRLAIKAVLIGILIAYLIMSLLVSTGEGYKDAFLWFLDINFGLNVFFGVGVMILSGHFIGQLAARLILLKEWDYIFTGIFAGFAIITTTTFFASLLGYFQEGVYQNYGSPFYDYVIKPIITITIFGFVPIVFVGIWFGIRVYKRGKKA